MTHRLINRRMIDTPHSPQMYSFIPPILLAMGLLLVFGCAENEVETNTGIASDEPQELSDWEALFADTPDPKTLPDELKSDQEFPARFDLADLQSPVKSQGSRGVCSIFSTVALMEHLYMKRGAVSPDFSEHFLQWSVKAELGRFKNTSGSNGSANLSAINRFGIVEESVEPYQSFSWSGSQDERCAESDENEDKKPLICFTNGEPNEGALNAERFKLPPSRWVGSERRNLKAFMVENETGVVVGMTFFYQSWNHRKSPLQVNSEYSRQGYVLYPNETDKEKSLEKRAGHSILIVGWDDELEVPIVDEEGKQVLDDEGNPVVERGFFLFKNSWGTANFGTANPFGPGYGWLSMRYVEEYGSAVSARPPEEELTERCDDGLDNNFDGLTDCDDTLCSESVSCQVVPERMLSFSVSSEESREIPDKDEVISTLSISNEGNIDHISVSFEIEHTFTGDLEINIESPSGTRVNLVSSNTESSLNELKIEQELPELRGEPVAGEWKLMITDQYAEDSGILKSWSLNGMISAEESGEPQIFETSPSLAIPDNDPAGISSELEVSAEGALKSLTATVRIDHPYRGDLVIRLVHPEGDVITLFNREGRNEENVELEIEVPELLQREAKGIWRLEVSDLGRSDEGQLLEWGLRLSTAL